MAAEAAGQGANQVRLHGVLVERTALRYTPAGVPVVEAQVQHRSSVVEAGLPRTLEFDVGTIALGDAARQLAAAELGSTWRMDGFLAPRSQRSKRILVHILEMSCLAPAGEPVDGGTQ